MTRIEGIDTAARVARALQEVPKELRPEVRKALKKIGQRVLVRARGKASWSSRIPGSLSLRTSFGKNAGVTVSARRQVAPHARPFEGIRGGSTFRHPVYGNRNAWVSQTTRPFLRPALAEDRAEIVSDMEKAVTDATTRAGL